MTRAVDDVDSTDDCTAGELVMCEAEQAEQIRPHVDVQGLVDGCGSVDQKRSTMRGLPGTVFDVLNACNDQRRPGLAYGQCEHLRVLLRGSRSFDLCGFDNVVGMLCPRCGREAGVDLVGRGVFGAAGPFRAGRLAGLSDTHYLLSPAARPQSQGLHLARAIVLMFLGSTFFFHRRKLMASWT